MPDFTEFADRTLPEWILELARRVRMLVRTQEGMAEFRRNVLQWADDRRRKLDEEDQLEKERDQHFDGLRAEHVRNGSCPTQWEDPPEPDAEFEYDLRLDHAQKTILHHPATGTEEVIPFQKDYVAGWVSKRLLRRYRPEYVPPLPLTDRVLTDVEQCALLAAVHDAVYLGVEQINPWRDLPEESRDGIPMAVLYHHIAAAVYQDLVNEALRLQKSSMPSLEAILQNVESALKAMGAPNRKKSAAIPGDLISLAVATQKYVVSRASLKRAIRSNELTSFRTPNGPRNAAHKVSEESVAAHWPKRG